MGSSKSLTFTEFVSNWVAMKGTVAIKNDCRTSKEKINSIQMSGRIFKSSIKEKENDSCSYTFIKISINSNRDTSAPM